MMYTMTARPDYRDRAYVLGEINSGRDGLDVVL